MAQQSNLGETAYALLRMVSGLLFSFHGAQKILGILPGEHPQPEPWTQIWVGGLIELLGGLAVMLGLGTRFAAFVCSGTMAVAYFQFHWKLQMGRELFPIVNQGELAVLYCFVFLLIACRGAGKWGMDKSA
jgi:putative oxidoreductase